MKKVNLAYNSYSLTSLFLSKLLPLAASSPRELLESRQPSQEMWFIPPRCQRRHTLPLWRIRLASVTLQSAERGKKKKKPAAGFCQQAAALRLRETIKYTAADPQCVFVWEAAEKKSSLSQWNQQPSLSHTRALARTHTQNCLSALIFAFSKGKLFVLMLLLCSVLLLCPRGFEFSSRP